MNPLLCPVVMMAIAVAAIACAPPPAAPKTAQNEAAPRIRQPVDTVGYTHTAEGISAVVAWAEEAEKHRFAESEQLRGVHRNDVYVGAISPHDDYRYAAGVYAHVYSHIQAEHVVLIGVAHKARDYPEVEGKLVFDSFDAWHGPYTDVPISPLRGDLTAGLSREDALIHDDLQAVEHSLEGLIPFLQHYNRRARIVPILVPYMSWDRLEALVSKTAAVLAQAMTRRGLVLGQDVAVLISSDSVHYGDEDWGGKVFADFGVDQVGYDRAVERDLQLIDDYLAGEIALSRLAGLYHSLVEEDYHEYKITWCGRFSIPFGVALIHALPHTQGRRPPRGVLLRYGTTLDPGPFDPGVPGLGFTAGASLRHWVGFASIGYD